MRNPISPRAGTRYSSLTQPVPWLTICSSRPRRSPSSWVTTPDVVLGYVDGQPLHRLVHRAVDHPGDHLRLADGDLEALPAHDLDQHGQLQLAAALHLPGVRPLGRQHPDRDVADQLGVEPVLHQPRGQLVAALPGQRRGVHAQRHGDRRLVDRQHRQRPRVVRVGQRLADRDVRDAGHRDQVARAGLLDRHPLQAVGHQQLADLDPLDRAVGAAPGRLLAAPDRAVVHPAQRQPAEVRRGVEGGHPGLQRHAVRRTSAPGSVATSVSNSGLRSALSGDCPSAGRVSEARPAFAWQ